MDFLRRRVRAVRRLCWMPEEDQENLRDAFVKIFCITFGFSFINYVFFKRGGAWFIASFIGAIYALYVYSGERYMKLSWSLWLHLGVLLVVWGVSARDMFGLIAESIVILGLFIILVISMAPCFGYRILNRRMPQHNGHAIVYQHVLEQV